MHDAERGRAERVACSPDGQHGDEDGQEESVEDGRSEDPSDER